MAVCYPPENHQISELGRLHSYQLRRVVRALLATMVLAVDLYRALRMQVASDLFIAYNLEAAPDHARYAGIGIHIFWLLTGKGHEARSIRSDCAIGFSYQQLAVLMPSVPLEKVHQRATSTAWLMEAYHLQEVFTLPPIRPIRGRGTNNPTNNVSCPNIQVANLPEAHRQCAGRAVYIDDDKW